MSTMKFGAVIRSLTVEAFINSGDLITARERLREVQRSVGSGSDFVKLAKAIIAFGGERAPGS